MRRLLFVFMLFVVLPVFGQLPIRRNFFTTNVAPVVDVLAGSNATVQASTTGTDERHFTVNAKTDTNVVNALIGAAPGTAKETVAGTNIIVVTNAGSFTVHGTTDTNVVNALIAASPAGGQTNNTIVAGLTNIVVVTNSGGGNTLYSIGGVTDTNVVNALIVPATNAVPGWIQQATNDLNTALAQKITDATNPIPGWILTATNDLNTALTTKIQASTNINTLSANGVVTNYSTPTLNLSSSTNGLGNDGTGVAGTNWVLQQISTLGSYVYFGGPTNTFAITNSGESVSRTNVFTGSTAPFVNASTSSVSSLVLNAYARHVISTNTFGTIEAGPVSIQTYPFRAGGGGTVSGHYEFYAVDVVSNIMYELGSTPVITVANTAPIQLNTSLVLTNGFIATNRCYAALAWKFDSIGSGGPTVSWAHGGVYDAHMTFVRPLSSATIQWSQITGTPARSVGVTVDGGGSAITAGTKGYISVPYAGTIQSCTIMASPSGSIEFRIWRTNSVDGSFPPTAAGAIGTNSLTSDNYNVDSTLSNWTKTLNAGDVLGFNVPAAATSITNCTLQLKIQP